MEITPQIGGLAERASINGIIIPVKIAGDKGETKVELSYVRIISYPNRRGVRTNSVISRQSAMNVTMQSMGIPMRLLLRKSPIIIKDLQSFVSNG